MPLVPARFRVSPSGLVTIDDGSPRPGGLGSLGQSKVERVNPRKPDIKYLKIPAGNEGTFATLKLMKKLVLSPWGHRHPDVALLARKITDRASPGLEKNYRAMASTLFEWTKANVPYRLDPAGLEWLQTPHYTLFGDPAGPIPSDCDDHAMVIASFALATGFQAGFRTARGDPGSNRWSHVYAVIGITKRGKTEWLAADSTQRKASLGWDPPEAHANGMKTWVIDPTLEDTEWEV